MLRDKWDQVLLSLFSPACRCCCLARCRHRSRNLGHSQHILVDLEVRETNEYTRGKLPDWCSTKAINMNHWPGNYLEQSVQVHIYIEWYIKSIDQATNLEFWIEHIVICLFLYIVHDEYIYSKCKMYNIRLQNVHICKKNTTSKNISTIQPIPTIELRF